MSDIALFAVCAVLGFATQLPAIAYLFWPRPARRQRRRVSDDEVRVAVRRLGAHDLVRRELVRREILVPEELGWNGKPVTDKPQGLR